jgi:hypothetical protein
MPYKIKKAIITGDVVWLPIALAVTKPDANIVNDRTD